MSESTRSQGVKEPGLLSMTLQEKTEDSEYGAKFVPKSKIIQPTVHLSPCFLNRQPPEFVRGQPREQNIPGYVAAEKYGGKNDYLYSLDGSFYASTKNTKGYFTVADDWLSEKTIRKNNPFS